MVECSEKSSKEQDFRDNKNDCSIAKASADCWDMMSLKGTLLDNVSSSLVYCEHICC